MYTMTDEDRKAKDFRLVIQKRQAVLEDTNAKMRMGRQPLEARAFHSEKSPQRRFCYVTSRMPTTGRRQIVRNRCAFATHLAVELTEAVMNLWKGKKGSVAESGSAFIRPLTKCRPS